MRGTLLIEFDDRADVLYTGDRNQSCGTRSLIPFLIRAAKGGLHLPSSRSFRKGGLGGWSSHLRVRRQ